MPQGKLDVNATRFYVASIACGLSYLNSLNVIHRDLKLENVMLTSEGQVKLIDFGCARILDPLVSNGRAFTFLGTPEYMAPESIRMEGYTTLSDWWALGVLIFELLVGTSPFVTVALNNHVSG